MIVLLSFLYGSISVLAVVGNFLVMWVVATSRRMQSVTNCYIANLALADIVIGLFAVPFQVSTYLLLNKAEQSNLFFKLRLYLNKLFVYSDHHKQNRLTTQFSYIHNILLLTSTTDELKRMLQDLSLVSLFC